MVLRSFTMKVGVQILLREYNFDNKVSQGFKATLKKRQVKFGDLGMQLQWSESRWEYYLNFDKKENPHIDSTESDER